MAFVIVDNSLLQVLTSVKRLDILERHQPLNIAPCVRKEHARRAPDPAEDYLQAQIKSGSVRVISPKLSDRGQALLAKYTPILGYCDAVGLAWAADTDSFFLTDDRALLRAADREGANTADLSAALLSCKDTGLLNAKQLRELLQAIETDADHRVPAATRKALAL